MKRDFTPAQLKIIKRYYDHSEDISFQRLQELVTELYLAEGKKADKYWKLIPAVLEKCGLAQQRIDHIMEKKDVKILAEVVKEVMAKKK